MTLSKKEIMEVEFSKNQVGIWYLGQEGFLFRSGTSVVAVDPYLSDYVDQNCSDLVPWKRLYAPPILAEELSFSDAVLCTHAHYDHADPITLSKIAHANPQTKIIVPAPCSEEIASESVPAEQMIPAHVFEKITVGDFEIIPIPSAHEEVHRDEKGDCYEVGYLIRTKSQTFFHAGDMCMYDGLIESLKQYDIDIAFLPINGRDYFRNRLDIMGNFNCEEAVLLAKEIRAKMLVPMHHDLYSVNGVKVENFVSAIGQYHPFRRYHIFSPGELYISVCKLERISPIN